MLKRRTWTLILFFCAMGVTAASGAQTLDEVLEKHFRAIGGSDAWRRVSSIRSEGKLTIEPPGVDAPLTTVAHRPGKARLEFVLMGTKGIQAIDGEAAWWHSPLEGAPDPVAAPEAVAESLRQIADVDGPLVDWQKSGHTVKLIGETEIDGEDLIELELELASGKRMQYFLDAESYLLVKTVDLDETGSVSTYGDYREVAGLRVPFQVETKTSTGKQTTTITSWEVNVSMDDSLFEMPASEKAGRETSASTEGVQVTTLAKIDAGTGGIELDASGNIYSSDFGAALGAPDKVGKRVWRIDSSGASTVFAEGLLGASGNAFDSEGNLLQANIGGNTISKITPDGKVTPFASEGLDRPVGIVIDDEGTLFVANCASGSIQRIDRDGNSSRFVESPLLLCPNGITMDDEHNLYVSNFYNGDVVRISRDGVASRLASLPGGNNGHLAYAGGKLYVVARGAHRIYSVSLSGEFSVIAGSGDRGNQDGTGLDASFCFPNDIAASADGQFLYINDVADCSEDGLRLAPSLIRRISVPSAVSAVPAKGRSLDVTIDYTGTGNVDDEHKIHVVLFENSDLDMGHSAGMQLLTENNATATFTDIIAKTVYLVALYSQHGASRGAQGPDPRNPVGVYGGSVENPRAIHLDQTSEVSLRFGESLRLADVMPEPETNPRLADAEGIVEIRMYRVKPGMRDAFVKFFEEKTLVPQGEVGMRVLGQFRSLEDDDTFVWVRAFRDQEERDRQVSAFYGGQLWVEELAMEAMSMLVSTEVLLVEPTAASPLR